MLPPNVKNNTTAAYANSLVVKNTGGTVYKISGYNSLAGVQFIQIHDATALPADGVVPAVILAVSAASNFSADFGVYGRRFTNGIVVCNSTTSPAKTLGAADCWIDAQYI